MISNPISLFVFFRARHETIWTRVGPGAGLEEQRKETRTEVKTIVADTSKIDRRREGERKRERREREIIMKKETMMVTKA